MFRDMSVTHVPRQNRSYRTIPAPTSLIWNGDEKRDRPDLSTAVTAVGVGGRWR